MLDAALPLDSAAMGPHVTECQRGSPFPKTFSAGCALASHHHGLHSAQAAPCGRRLMGRAALVMIGGFAPLVAVAANPSSSSLAPSAEGGQDPKWDGTRESAEAFMSQFSDADWQKVFQRAAPS